MKHSMRFWFSVFLMLTLAGAAMVHSGFAIAAPTTTITVSTTADELNHDGDCSLREALKAANTNTAVDACPAGGANDTIELPSGSTTATVYTLTLTGTDDVSGDLDLTTNITLQGLNKASPIIEGGVDWSDRILDVGAVTVVIKNVVIRKGKLVTAVANAANAGAGVRIASGATVTIENSTITLNQNKGLGAGIYNQGNLTLIGSMVSSNSSDSGGTTESSGGGLYNSGVATVTNSTFQNNTVLTVGSSSYKGGNIFNASTLSLDGVTVKNGSAFSGGGIHTISDLVVKNSTLSGNNATNGGGIFLSNGSAHFVNSTLSGNAGNTGGGMYMGGGTATLSSVTVTANQAGNQAGGIFIPSGTLRVKNSIVAGNTGTNADCAGSPVSDGNNLIGQKGTCANFVNGAKEDLVGSADAALDAKLGALASNGGKTQTHALTSASPAIDAGNASGCTDKDDAALSTDQRGAGFARTLDGFGSGTPRCDIGAFEAPANSAVTATPTATRTPTQTLTPTPTQTATSSVPQLTISGKVWADSDFDGILETGEVGLESVVVELWNGDKTELIDRIKTNTHGGFSLTGPAGNLRLHVILPTGYTFSPFHQGGSAVVWSDIHPDGADVGFSNVATQGSGGLNMNAGMYTGVTPTPQPTATSTPTAGTGCNTAPVPVKPKDKAIVTKLRPRLSWNLVDCATDYQLILYAKKVNGNIIQDVSVITATSFRTKPLTAGKTYAWQVRACNANGCSPFSTARKFSVAP